MQIEPEASRQHRIAAVSNEGFGRCRETYEDGVIKPEKPQPKKPKRNPPRGIFVKALADLYLNFQRVALPD
jgi:hypothetical protein